MIKRIPYSIKYLFSSFSLGLIFFTLIRVLFLWNNSALLTTVPAAIVFKSLLVGARFDTVVLSYLLSVPFLLFLFSHFIKGAIQKALFFRVIHFISVLLFCVAFLIAIANIPFYQNYHLFINKAALHWSNDVGFSIKMIFQDSLLVGYLGLFVVVTLLFFLGVSFSKRRFIKASEISPKNELIMLLFLLPLLILGMRGRVSVKSPIRWGTAYFSSYDITNQAALNPVFTFFISQKDNIKRPFFDSEKALEEIQKNIRFKNKKDANDTLLLSNYNIIIVLMESMGSNKTGLFKNGQHLTPNLDSIAKISLFYNKCYSDGIHTFNGLFSTLTAFPALPMNKPLEDLRINLPENTFIKTLKEKSYQTFFFTTHDTQFDNMEGFMRKNGIEHIIGEADFSKNEVLSATGVPDHILYNKCIEIFDTLHSPFFALLLSGSDHAPYAIPDNIAFKPDGRDKRKDIVKYADWSIGNFLNQAKQKKWFNNTLFVFVGDHGSIVDQEADIYLGMHHIPLLFFAPEKIHPEVNNKLCGQVDILPSIAHLLNINYSNKPFGVNLFKEERNALSFTYDEHLIGINQNAFYVYRPYDPNLFLINPEEKHCTVSTDSTIAKELRNFSFATMELSRKKLFALK
ncbi:MAG: LTA synthase family protein [Bacteroidia bacterium]